MVYRHFRPELNNKFWSQRLFYIRDISELMTFQLSGVSQALIGLLYICSFRSGGGLVDNTLDYQSRDRKIDPPLLQSFG